MIDFEIVMTTLNILKSGRLVELRSAGKQPMSGYFRDYNRLLQVLKNNQNKTFYFTLNQIKDECYSREQCEQIVVGAQYATSDNDIARREWILIDCDPNRSSGISSTNDEKTNALETARKVYIYLKNIGFSEPVVADSGNGYHLLYRVDIRHTEENTNTIKMFLQSLDMIFSDDNITIDTSVFNSSRITKLYGVMATKGANTEERPHRMSKLIKIPESINTTSIALFKQVALLLPQKPIYKKTNTSNFSLDEFISKHGIAVSHIKKWSGGEKYVLENCVFDYNHKSPDAAIILLNNGALAYHCFHNSCQNYSWQDIRLNFEPDVYEPKEQPLRTTRPQFTNTLNETQNNNTEKYLRMQDITRYDRSQIVSIKSGFYALDKKIIGFNKGELSIWSGSNSSGKSTILSQLALESVNNGFNVAMFSGEMTSHRMKNWLHLQAAGREYNMPTDFENVFHTPTEIADKIDIWLGDKLWLYNNDYGFEATSVIDDTMRHIVKHKTDVVILDNLMSLDLSQMQGEKNDKQSIIVNRLAMIAKQYNVHCHFVCHPRKPNGFLRKNDISGTSDITNAADNVIMAHRVNQDFKKALAEYMGAPFIKNFENHTNVIEVMKNRDLGIQDEFIGLYYEHASKRLLNSPYETKTYSWYDKKLDEVTDLPFMA